MTSPALYLPGQVTPEVISLREWGWLEKPIKLTQQDRVALAELNRSLKRGALVVTDTPEGSRLQARQYVGVFSLPSYTVHVEPKTETPVQNILFMLLSTQKVKKYALPDAWQKVEKIGDFVEQLAALYVVTLRQEMGRGLLRQSQHVREDSPTVRGRLRVTEYLRRRDPTRLPVEYPDLTANIPVNRLLAAALRHVVRFSKRSHLRGEAHLLLGWFNEAGVQTLGSIPRNKDAYSLNRLQLRYTDALKLAWMILEGIQPLPTPGKVQAMTFTVDMDKLFERFLEQTVMNDVLSGTPFQGFAQGKTPVGQLFLFRNKQLQLKPDLVVWKGDKPQLIIDFKNKRPEGRPDDSDLYQMYAYARHLNCPNVLLLYPGSVRLPQLQTSHDPMVTITAAGIDLRRDLRVHYPDLIQDLRALLAMQGVS